MYLEFKYILGFSGILILFILLITITCGKNKKCITFYKYMNLFQFLYSNKSYLFII